LKPDGVLSPQRVVNEARQNGSEAHAMGSSEEIIDFVASRAQPGDRIVIMSNGSFDDIHRRLLDRLNLESSTGINGSGAV
jgi:UDP-N-acetylmuramate: L-alanyl-gamma-D-glutamyl-meso-diaminopimelate ligase